ncbi:MAG TPA: hypothetical protein VEX68_07775 [Bryobacteraceae bacterium]|nr:hypothetical protein [Bryobacteraceae bacterium]
MAAEAFEFVFERRGKTLAVTGLKPNEGIVLDGETSAWPLGVALQLAPISAGTRVRWENIQRQQGWIGARTFGLSMSIRNGRLRCEGIKPKLLPEGTYQVSIFLGGYRFHTKVYEFTIPKDDTAVIVVQEKPDRRRVQLDRAISDFDASTRNIVEASVIDGIGLADWLGKEDRRDARKACVLNVLAKLRTPIAGKAPLSDGVKRLIFADVDRVYAELEPKFVNRIMLPDGGFDEDAVIHSTHLRLLQFVPNGLASHLHSVRERVAKLSMQLTLAIPDDGEAPQYADIDIDLGNPFVTPLGFVVHLGELIDSGKTDHLGLRKKLQDTASSDFLYYRIVED